MDSLVHDGLGDLLSVICFPFAVLAELVGGTARLCLFRNELLRTSVAPSGLHGIVDVRGGLSARQHGVLHCGQSLTSTICNGV